ncbi:GNAT family N-acetyltransferase [Desertivirga xinjiangensis]|uniref:GNAT family N-acetyltransferase n=1 Tax=Desertivirga xinjiangensis TaxID=539206 RepID=UPI00210CC2B9|nr:GNAT family N-acetyltransferase [Pedobacter xinjiangensis]
MNAEKTLSAGKQSRGDVKTIIEFDRTDSKDLRFINVVRELDANLYAMYNNNNYQFDVDIKVDNINTVILACIRSITVGGGCFKEIDSDTVEFKRMFVNPYFRGLGVASGILDELILWAKELNYSKVVLETGERQADSISLFEKHQFSVIDNFGPYIGIKGSVCMGRDI